MSELKDMLIEAFGINKMGHLIDERSIELFLSLTSLLKTTNETTNLTAITDDEGIVLKHYVDCCAISDLIPCGSSVIDIGCGPGFPTLPLAIIRPDLNVTAVDSTGKKIDFLKTCADKLQLCNVNAVCERAEDYVADRRESFDFCVSRAVARLNVLSELCLPFVRVGGEFIAMKSGKAQEELIEANKAIHALGGSLKDRKGFSLSLGDAVIDRELVITEKTSATNTKYPRNFSQIRKKPL